MRFFTTDKSTEIEKQIKESEDEVKMLKKSHNELFIGRLYTIKSFLDYTEYLRDHKVFKDSESKVGKVKWYFGLGLTLYCIYRLLMVRYSDFLMAIESS
jgi:hypothetical protein